MTKLGDSLKILEGANWRTIERIKQLTLGLPSGMGATDSKRLERIFESTERTKRDEQSGSTLYGHLMAAAMARSGAAKIPDPARVAQLLAEGADPDEPNPSHCSLLELLLEDHPAHLACAKLLLDAGARPDGRGFLGSEAAPPLYFAAEKGLTAFCRLVAAEGGELDWPASWCPLGVAAKRGRKGSILALVDAGADVEVKDPVGMTPARIAAQWGQAECLDALAGLGADLSDIETWIDSKPGSWEVLDASERAAIRAGKKACRAVAKSSRKRALSKTAAISKRKTTP